MTAIEFNQLSKDDISKFNYNQIIDFYKFIATVSEKRYIDYKSQLENLYKSKINTIGAFLDNVSGDVQYQLMEKTTQWTRL